MERNLISNKDAQLYSLLGITIALFLYTLISLHERSSSLWMLVSVTLVGALSANAPFVLEAIPTVQVLSSTTPILILLTSILILLLKRRLHSSPVELRKTHSYRECTSLVRQPAVREFTNSLNWSQLPESIMFLVLNHVSHEDLKNIRIVCRDWYSTLTHSLECLKPTGFYPAKLIRDFPLLRILDLSQCVEQVDSDGLQSLHGLHQLTQLSLGQHHNLIASSITNKCLISLKLMKKIRVLNLAQCVHITDGGLFEISRSLLELEEINLSGCVAVTDTGVHELARIASLRTLELAWCLKISDRGLQSLTNASNLTQLNISGCQLITEFGIHQIGVLTNLEMLNLMYTGSNQFCQTDESLQMLRGLTKLHTLSLGGMQLQHTRITNQGLKTISKNFPMMSSLSLICLEITNEGIMELTSLSRLETLSLKGCVRVTSGSLQSIGKLVMIKELSVVHSPWFVFNDESLEALSPLTSIEKLELGNTQNGNLLTDYGMAILASFEKLKTLSLSQFHWHFAGSGLGPLTKLQSLTNVDFTGNSYVNDSSLSVIGLISSIQSLQLNKCHRISNIGLKHLMKLNKLSSLSLAGCFRVGDPGLEYLAEMPSLCSLILSQCISVTDLGLNKVTKLKKLKTLDLFGCREIHGHGFEGFQSIPLSTLNISDCAYLLDEGVQQIGKITSLTKLELCGCFSVTDVGIGTLKQLTNLTGVDVSLCGCLGNPSMYILGQLPKLTTFKLSGSDLVTDVGVRHIAKTTGLLTVHLDRCQNVTDRALQYLANCKSLTSLRLARCAKITDVGILHLTALEQLSILNLTQCPLVTDQGIQSLAQLTSLASLEF
eukprot:g7236.t1